MRPVSGTVVGAVNGSTVPLDYMIAPFQVSVGVVLVSGSVSYKLQYTYDDLYDAAVTPVWFDSIIMVAQTATSDVVINAGPVAAVRIVNAGTGTVRYRIIQAGV